MGIKWTNVFNLPGPLVDLVKTDLYHESRTKQLLAYKERMGLPVETPHYSVSDLIKPPRMRELIKRHWDEIVKDVSADIFRLLGQLFHHAFRDSAMRSNEAGAGYIAEQRMFAQFVVDGEVVIVSGEPDLVSADGTLDDYKVTALYNWDKGVKIEWEQQLNCYSFLRYQSQLDTLGLRAIYILRDWKQSESMQEGYPPAASLTMEVRHWTREEQQAYLQDRLKTHQDARGRADDRLPECSPAEMWERPEAWAVQREGGKRAAKVYRQDAFPPGTPSETLKVAANADAEIRNGKLKKGELPYAVEHRPGERVRCQSYCDARSFCNIYKEYASAAYRSTP